MIFVEYESKQCINSWTKNIFSQSDGIVPKEEESPMLKHLLNWKESVVIIDEYEKMKLKSNFILKMY